VYLFKVGVDGLLDKAEHGPALLPAGGLDRPETLTPLLALASPGYLGNAPIDHAKAQSALGDIVGRLNAGTSDKGEVDSAVGAEAHTSNKQISLCAKTVSSLISAKSSAGRCRPSSRGDRA